MKQSIEKTFFISQKFKALPSGFGTLFKGVSYSWSDKKILGLCLIPIVISAVFLFFGFSVGYGYVFSAVSSLAIKKSSFSFFGGSVLLWLVTLIVKILSGFIFILGAYIVLQVLYIPFCSVISEKILKTKGIARHATFKEMMFFNIKMMKVGVLKAVVLAFIGLFCFASSFVPFLGLLPLYFGFLVLAYDSFDYGLELYGFDFSERKKFFSKSFLTMNGHAGFLFFLSVIPGVILLLLPFSVVGASLTLGEFYEAKKHIT